MTVYLAESDVPGEYQVIGRVSGFAKVASLREYERMRIRVLGREGARVGADAVLIPDDQPEPGRGDVGLAMPRGPGRSNQVDARFSGVAIRFIPGTCTGHTLPGSDTP